MTSREGPLFPHIGVVGVSWHRWTPQWMTQHQVMSRLAKYFKVIWIEPPEEWRHSARQFARSTTHGRNPVPRIPGFEVDYSPWIPRFYRPAELQRKLIRFRARRVWRRLKASGCERVVLYLWRPQYASWFDDLPHDFSIYHIDDEYSFTDHDVPTSRAELDVLDRANHVIIHSRGLMEKKGGGAAPTTFLPQGVDFAAFSAVRPEPADLAVVPHPRIGYTGFLKDQLDWPLLGSLADRHPDFHFVYVGGRTTQTEVHSFLEAMSQRSNVHFLGEKTVDLLAEYPQHFDVCIMPYRRMDYTDSIYPLKLHEYLATGRPVVSSPIRTVQDFDDVIRIAGSVDQWSEQLLAALDPEGAGPNAAQERRAVAMEHDWSRIVSTPARIILNALAEPDSWENSLELDGPPTR